MTPAMSTETDRRLRPLVTRLRAARMLMQTWRRPLFSDVFEARRKGEPPPEHVERELAKWDEAIESLAEAIKIAKDTP